ncbi:MAG: hypothetical protein E6G60_06930 [Actinobacteria bacterium]|nr:MAG: hypothetical protein E6G60_06930 [Actinomycetota bacterium]
MIVAGGGVLPPGTAVVVGTVLAGRTRLRARCTSSATLGGAALAPRVAMTRAEETPAIAMGVASLIARPRSAPRRMGCSTRKYDAVVKARVTPSRRASSAAPLSPTRCSVSATNTGQCHRYSPYETFPIATNGCFDSSHATGERPGMTVVATTLIAVTANKA